MYHHKRGDSFLLTGKIDETIANVSDFTGWTGESQVRNNKSELIAQLTFAWVDATTGKCQLTHLDTSDWPLGNLWLDIRLTSSAGFKVSTGRELLFINQGVTEDV
jgi:hypothetical protein